LAVAAIIGGGITLWQVEIAQQSADTSQKSVLLAQKSERDVRLLSEKQLADSQNQSEQTLAQMRAQTSAQVNAGRASRDGADTAKEALHVSERAYITLGRADLDELTQHRIRLQFTNVGRIPSKQVTVIIYRTATHSQAVPGGVEWVPDNSEKGWHRTVYDRVFPTAPVYLTVLFPSVSPESIMDGARELIVAGTLTYDDGFSYDPLTTEDFCFRTFADMGKKQIIATSCDTKRLIPRMQELTGYPNNEEDQGSFQ
jgi:hypothetical protein